MEGPLAQGSGHIPGRWETEGQQYYPQKLRSSAHSPSQAQRENPLLTPVCSHPPFSNPPEEPGLLESNNREGRGWPVYIQPHRSGDGEFREDNLMVKVSFT